MLETSTHLLVAAVWGILIIISWLGFGSFINSFLWHGSNGGDRRLAPLGLLAGWGMAAFICLGGVLLWLHLAGKSTLVLMTIAGAIAGIRELWQRRSDLRGEWGNGCFRGLIHLPIVLLLLFVYAGGMQWAAPALEPDDLPAYLPFTHEILQTGGLVQPFSLRRIASYGGQSLLQAQVLSGTSDVYLGFLEKGLSPMIICLLMLGLMSPKAPRDRLLAYAAIGVLLMIGMPRINTNCLATGVVIFLTLFATVEYWESSCRESESRWNGLWITLGLISSAAISLRINFIPGIVLALLLYFLISLAGSRISGRQLLYGGMLFCGVTALTLAPWALALWESSHTPLYPLIKGNYRETGLFSARVPIGGLLRYFVSVLVPYFMWPVLLGIALCITRRTARIGIPFYISAIVASLAVIYFSPEGESIHAYRYSFPMLFAVEAGLIGLTLQDQAHRAMRIVGIAVILVLLISQTGLIAEEFKENVSALRIAISAPPFIDKQVVDQYRQAQQAIPEGKRVLVMTHYPHLFDYSRNRIDLVDLPGNCSPGHGMPMMQPVAALKDYLVAQGIDYVIHDNFEAGLYSWAVLREIYMSGKKQVKVIAPYIQYTMNALVTLGMEGYAMGDYGALRVLRIH